MDSHTCARLGSLYGSLPFSVFPPFFHNTSSRCHWRHVLHDLPCPLSDNFGRRPRLQERDHYWASILRGDHGNDTNLFYCYRTSLHEKRLAREVNSGNSSLNQLYNPLLWHYRICRSNVECQL